MSKMNPGFSTRKSYWSLVLLIILINKFKFKVSVHEKVIGQLHFCRKTGREITERVSVPEKVIGHIHLGGLMDAFVYLGFSPRKSYWSLVLLDWDGDLDVYLFQYFEKLLVTFNR